MEIEEKRAKNLCFLCDEAYFPGHKCKVQVYSLEVVIEAKEDGAEEVNRMTGENELKQQQEEPPQHENSPQLSLNALNGTSAYHTMRVIGRFKHTPLHILIDSGSTHNFLNLATTKKLHCVIKKIPPLQVGVANGQYLPCPAMCEDFSWSLLGETFTTDVMLVTLGNYDMVLGI